MIYAILGVSFLISFFYCKGKGPDKAYKEWLDEMFWENGGYY